MYTRFVATVCQQYAGDNHKARVSGCGIKERIEARWHEPMRSNASTRDYGPRFGQAGTFRARKIHRPVECPRQRRNLRRFTVGASLPEGSHQGVHLFGSHYPEPRTSPGDWVIPACWAQYSTRWQRHGVSSLPAPVLWAEREDGGDGEGSHRTPLRTPVNRAGAVGATGRFGAGCLASMAGPLRNPRGSRHAMSAKTIPAVKDARATRSQPAGKRLFSLGVAAFNETRRV